ncbi:MAG: sel1 repeat family protein [Oxalobacter sp.]|nr:sel1 repeat family protein [Oxalobacter sp.]
MQYNRMRWWMGVVLLLACLFLSNRAMSHAVTVTRDAGDGKKPLVVVEKSTQRLVPGAPDPAVMAVFMKKAESGDERARSVLGIMYAFGIGVDLDSEKGVDIFGSPELKNNSRYMRSLLGVVKAAAANDSIVDAQGRLLNEEEEERLAYERLAGAAKNGDSSTWLALGIVYASGTGTGMDFVQAASWITKAAQADDALAQALLGMMYETGMGVVRDENASGRWYARSEAHPELTQQESIQFMAQLMEVMDGYIEKMLAVLLELAEKGDAEAQYRLGEFYEELESGKNDQAAYAWYKKAALRDHVKAQYALGRIYEEGRDGISPDRKEALKWYKKAASHRDMDAMKKVAELQ